MEIVYFTPEDIGTNAYYIVFEYEKEEVGIETAPLSLDPLNNRILNDVLFDPQIIKARLQDLSNTLKWVPSTGAIVNAAIKRGIPSKRLPTGLFLMGYGKYQKRISASILETTGYIAVDIARIKTLQKNYCRLR